MDVQFQSRTGARGLSAVTVELNAFPGKTVSIPDGSQRPSSLGIRPSLRQDIWVSIPDVSQLPWSLNPNLQQIPDKGVFQSRA